MQKYISYLVLFCLTISLQAQETKTDSLKTEEIIVVKPYTPSISDAFKIKNNPVFDESNSIQKEKVSYSIFSFPVVSTFAPAKGKARPVQKDPKMRIFENYVSGGFGNFTSPFFEAYIHTGDSRHNDLGFFLNHHSSKGGIKDVKLDDNFSDTRIDAYYKQFDRDYNWQINAGLQRSVFNYYGLRTDYTYDETHLQNLDEEQIHKTVYAGGKIRFEDSFFKGATAELINFSDGYDSNELRLLIKPTLEFPISTEIITADFSVDLVTGKFHQQLFLNEQIKHSFLNLGFSPSFEVIRDNLKVNLGAKLYYSKDLERKTDDFLAYPNVTASLNVIEEIFTLIAGATGDLIQNTYGNLAATNPYLSPTQDILQTDQQYQAYIGTKGKLANNIGYLFKVSHTNSTNHPFFVLNTLAFDSPNTPSTVGYEQGNSFSIAYDQLKTLGVFASLDIDISDTFTFKATMDYAKHDPSNFEEAWNLSSYKGTAALNYNNNQWFAGAKIFFRGSTKDREYALNPLKLEVIVPGEIVSNKAYLDLNLHGGYLFSDRLTAFARINNALGEKYHRFYNYQVLPLQIMAGITYKFDLD